MILQSGILHLILHYTSQRYKQMRNKQHVTKEIVELSAIKASYNHYLASGRSIFEVENTTQLYYNLCVINRSLRQLFEELKTLGIREKGLAAREKATDNGQPLTGNKQLAMGSYFLSPEFKALETRAIMQFNSDRRFTITE